MPPAAFGNYPEFRDPASGLTLTFGTPDLGVGTNRLAFAIFGIEGFVRIPVVSLKTFFLPNGVGSDRTGPVEEVVARFQPFPLGLRGSYVTSVNLDRAGAWEFVASFPRADGTITSFALRVEVPLEPRAPAIGSQAPRSKTPTIDSVGSLEKLTTASEPDPELYRLSIADAVASGRPTVVVFTSPAFCTTALCGPQVEVLSQLRARFGDRANYVHVDLYEAPEEIKGDLTRARKAPAVEEWRLDTDEWTFVVDASGRIAGRFESFASEAELIASLEPLLATGRQPGR
jgi:hypothetical protein